MGSSSMEGKRNGFEETRHGLGASCSLDRDLTNELEKDIEKPRPPLRRADRGVSRGHYGL